MLFDYLVVSQIVPTNPAAPVKGPTHVVKRGKTPVLSVEDARTLLHSIPTDSLQGLSPGAFCPTPFLAAFTSPETFAIKPEVSTNERSYDVGELVRDLEKVARSPKRFKVPGVKDKRLRWLAGSTIVLALLLGMALFGPTAFHMNPPGQSNSVTPTPNPIQTSLLPKPAPQASTGSEVQAGHLAYKLLKADLSQGLAAIWYIGRSRPRTRSATSLLRCTAAST